MRETGTQGAATAVAPAQEGQAARPRPLIHALLFVLGFSVVFVAVGSVMSGIGQLVFDLREPLARIGGVVVILFGLATMGLFVALSKWLGRLEDSAAEEGAHWWLLPIGWMKGGVDAVHRPDAGRDSGAGPEHRDHQPGRISTFGLFARPGDSLRALCAGAGSRERPVALAQAPQADDSVDERRAAHSHRLCPPDEAVGDHRALGAGE